MQVYFSNSPQAATPPPSYRECDIGQEWDVGDEEVAVSVKRYQTKAS
jgi:hypothetical protein